MGLARGALVGIVGLAALDWLVTSPATANGTVASGALGGAFKVLDAGVNKLVNPSIPGVADHASGSASASSSSASSSSSTSGPVGPTGPIGPPSTSQQIQKINNSILSGKQ